MSACLSPRMARGRAGTGLVLWLGILAVAAGLGIAGTAVVDAQDAPAVGIEVRVWQHVEDDGDLYISVRQKGGSWGTLGTIPLSLDDGLDPTKRYRYGDTALGVPLGGGISVTIEVRVWQHVESGRRFYIGARPAGGSWTTLGATRLHLDDGLSSRRIFRYGDIPVDVPLPADPHLEACSNGIAVPEPGRNPGLVSDCAVLLKARDILAGEGEPREWSDDRPGAIEARMFYGEDESPNWRADLLITSWRAVTVEEGRVTELRWPHPGLRGRIPGVLGDLSHLEFLWLSSELTGVIPPELGQLGKLRELWLSSNELTGSIPPELGQLSNLEELRLSGNQLTGNIPAELGQLGKLEYLWLYRNELTGGIPPELGMLSSIRSVELHENRLSGRIPAELGGLSNLRELELRDNNLTGEIPPELAPLRSLYRLDLRNNDLSGSIPQEFAELGNPFSASIYLSGNKLTGCIPLPLGRALHDRQALGISYCQCPTTWERSSRGEPGVTFGGDGIPYMPHGSTERAGTYRVTFSLVLDLPPGGDFSLDYKRRNDAGRIIVDIEEEKSRSSLTIDPFTGEELGRSALEGPAGCAPTVSGLFDQIVASARVEPLEVPARPNGIPAMRRLQPVEGGRSYYIGYSDYLVVDVPAGVTLTLDVNSLVCADRCFQWLELRDETSGSFILITSDSGFVRSPTIVEDGTGRDLDALFDSLIASIRRVPPPHEGASCDTPPTSADCATLIEARDTLAGDATLNWHLDTPLWAWEGVRVNPWTGRVVDLDLTRHELSGQIPPALGRLTGLEVLDLRDNELSGGIPPELGQLANLRELHIGSSPLGGEIPPELGSLTSLVELTLYGSDLSGGIPPELGQLVNLRELHIGSNSTLGGEIPPELGLLTSLVELTLSNNDLRGGIPPELGRLVNLRELSLASNPLGGEIPRELGSLSRLMRLYLYSADLVGEIPEELGHLTLLQRLHVYGNYLEGCIPAGLEGLVFAGRPGSNPDLRHCEDKE